MKKKTYKSEILMVIHQHIEAGYKLGLVSDQEMREFDEDCLVPEADPSARGASSHRPVTPAYARTNK
ncbi:hypothetical protein FACS189447_09860 [Spirochaetia bacterium]|nr:hypothetical protein FACS189447_09860 [Spirochaetia bacterium]